MGKRIFLSSSVRNWRYISKVKERHEFDSSYNNVISSRSICDESKLFDNVITSNKVNTVSTYSLIRKISEVSSLPESIVHCVLMDMIDLVSFALTNNKNVSIHSFGSFSVNEGSVVFKPSKQLLNESLLIEGSGE